MRTTLDLDDRLVGSLLERLPGTSKTRAIELAIEEYLAADAYDGLREMAGTVELDSAAIEASRIADRRRDARATEP
ncbi:MAG: type II toxin-antitoxin system VapB family antitoxin [Solirubrobacterales bacterium]|nr:type II toxin-antitoxin system VapB family antitoxin [Solirubrobacterales bacterium]